jgi:nucleotide-binding universal stress UspA family protein
MMNAEKILVAIDDSEASRAILPVVAERAAEDDATRLVLCHFLPHLPPRLLESRGSEDPREERAIERRQELQQAQRVEAEASAAERLMRQCRRTLERCGVSGERIDSEVKESHYAHERLADALLEEAKECGCTTIAVGRHSFPALREILDHHIGEELQRHANDVTVWTIG